MVTLKLNLGCGSIILDGWENIDYQSNIPGVLNHDLSKGIPYDDASVESVYHSHVLEHFTKDGGKAFIKECYRVLIPGGAIRVAVPDLEVIASNYLAALQDTLEAKSAADFRYDWSLVELLDQMVRVKSGGEAKKLLSMNLLPNEQLVYKRWGQEARILREKLLNTISTTGIVAETECIRPSMNLNGIRGRIAKLILRPQLRALESRMARLESEEKALHVGQFRLKGEVHQWMYDRYSLGRLLSNLGFVNIMVKDAFTSNISDWKDINPDLDDDGNIRKPDSLFMEAEKPASH